MYEKKKTLRGILKKERKKRKRKASQTDRQTEGKQASLVEQWEPAQEKLKEAHIPSHSPLPLAALIWCSVEKAVTAACLLMQPYPENPSVRRSPSRYQPLSSVSASPSVSCLPRESALGIACHLQHVVQILKCAFYWMQHCDI